MAGLAVGALVSGLLVQYGPDPQQLVFWVMLVIYALALPSALIMPDRVVRAPCWLRSMSPQVGVPPAARPQFAAMAPSLAAMWALRSFGHSHG